MTDLARQGEQRRLFDIIEAQIMTLRLRDPDPDILSKLRVILHDVILACNTAAADKAP